MALTKKEKRKIIDTKAFEAQLEGTTTIMGVDFNNAELAKIKADGLEEQKAKHLEELKKEVGDIKKEYNAPPVEITQSMASAFKLDAEELNADIEKGRIARKENIKKRLNEIETELSEGEL